MRMLVLGPSGGVGRWLVRLALERGHDVTALVRPESWRRVPEGARLVLGSVTDAATLSRALDGQAAVLSALGLRRASVLPWSSLRSPPDLLTQVGRLLPPLMRERRVHRLLAVSAAGVGESVARCTPAMQRLIRTANIGVAYRDLARMEAAFAASDLDWQVVRPVTLRDGAPTGRARVTDRYDLFAGIRRADVAAWMLDQLTDRREHGDRAPMIDGRGRPTAPLLSVDRRPASSAPHTRAAR